MQKQFNHYNVSTNNIYRIFILSQTGNALGNTKNIYFIISMTRHLQILTINSHVPDRDSMSVTSPGF